MSSTLLMPPSTGPSLSPPPPFLAVCERETVGVCVSVCVCVSCVRVCLCKRESEKTDGREERKKERERERQKGRQRDHGQRERERERDRDRETETHLCTFSLPGHMQYDLMYVCVPPPRLSTDVPLSSVCIGCRRPTGCLKLQFILCKRATNYRALLRKMTYKDRASYGPAPPCSALC